MKKCKYISKGKYHYGWYMYPKKQICYYEIIQEEKVNYKIYKSDNKNSYIDSVSPTVFNDVFIKIDIQKQRKEKLLKINNSC